MVGGHQFELAVGEPVAPRVADVGDGYRRFAVVGGGDRRQHDGGAHAVGVVEHRTQQDLAVGDLDRSVKGRLLDDRRARQVAGDLVGGDGAGNAAGDVAAHPVGDDAEPLGDDVAVLVGGTPVAGRRRRAGFECDRVVKHVRECGGRETRSSGTGIGPRSV